MSINLIAKGYNENQKSDSEREKEIVEKKKQEIAARHKDNQRILKYFRDGFKEIPEKQGYPRPTDPDKMSPMQLLSAGYDKLDDERKTKEEKNTKTINLNKERTD